MRFSHVKQNHSLNTHILLSSGPGLSLHLLCFVYVSSDGSVQTVQAQSLGCWPLTKSTDSNLVTIELTHFVPHPVFL